MTSLNPEQYRLSEEEHQAIFEIIKSDRLLSVNLRQAPSFRARWMFGNRLDATPGESRYVEKLQNQAWK